MLGDQLSSIIQTFRRDNRSAGLPHRRGRGPLFTPQQDDAICEMVIANNAIRLGEIQSAIIDNHDKTYSQKASQLLTECLEKTR
ncbi:hypothetical protein SRHO_G00116600 [Serrasalmus rhombeus]